MTTINPNADYWAAYDRLPSPVREVLQGSTQPFDPVAIEFQWHKFRAAGISAEGYAERLARADDLMSGAR